MLIVAHGKALDRMLYKIRRKMENVGRDCPAASGVPVTVVNHPTEAQPGVIHRRLSSGVESGLAQVSIQCNVGTGRPGPRITVNLRDHV